MPNRPQKPGRTPPQTAPPRRGGGGGLGGLASLFGIGVVPSTTEVGGDSAAERTGGAAQDAAASAAGNVSGAISPPVGQTNFTVTNPFWDYVLNRGQGHLLAQQGNIEATLGGLASQRALSNAKILQGLQQDFRVKELGIIHNDNLDEAQKKAALDQATAEHNANVAVVTGAGIISNPENTAEYNRRVSPIALNAAEAGESGKFQKNLGDLQQLSARAIAQGAQYPDLVQTQKNTIGQLLSASQGAMENQPLANAATRAQLEYAPSIARAEASRAPLFQIPYTSVGAGPQARLFNTITGGYANPAGMSFSDMMGMLGGGGSKFGANTGALSQATSPFATNIPGLPSGLGTTPATMQAPSGNVFLPDGSIRLPDGRIMKPDGTISQ